jgi:radical SAM protein with 4Fe4S-binding SPASM domain
MADGFLNLLLGRLPAYTRKTRHFEMLRRYGTPRKIANLARAELAKARGDVVLRSRPYVYTVDIGNICNLRCPLCPTGTHDQDRPQGFMSFADFQKVIDQIAPYAIELVLHNWGEPFLNPNFLDIVRTAKRAGIGTATSTNLNLVNKDVSFLREVVDSGLDNLVVSLDGTTQEVYGYYRRGGDLEHALRNLKELCAYKKESGSRTPSIEWQFLVMKHNEHQIDDARRLAAAIGVDTVRVTGAGLPFDDLGDVELGEQWLTGMPDYKSYDPEKIRARGYIHEEKCFYLYRAMTVNPRGEVAPCCAISQSKWDFGNILEDGLDAVWNNPSYRSARALFARRAEPQPVHTVCHVCPLFRYEQKSAVSDLVGN